MLSSKRLQNFSKNILNSIVIGACQSFQLFRQNTWFLGNRYRNLRYFIRIINYEINQSVKVNFILTTRTTLTLKDTKQQL